MIYTHGITSKGQITIPKEFRDKLGLDVGGKASMRLNNKGEIILSAPKSLGQIRQTLGQPTARDSLTDHEKLIIPGLLKKYEKHTR